MTGGSTPEARGILGLPHGDGSPEPADLEQAERTIDALLRLRDQLLHTQAALDDYLGAVGAHADEAPRVPGGA